MFSLDVMVFCVVVSGESKVVVNVSEECFGGDWLEVVEEPRTVEV